jgi:hypothetical protein
VVLPLLPVIAITFGLILCKCQVAILLSASCVFSTTKVGKLGAVALLVSKKVESSLPTLVVENTQDALSKIATWHLHNIKPKVRFLVSVQTSLKVTLSM